jgi:hypothetical protein
MSVMNSQHVAHISTHPNPTVRYHPPSTHRHGRGGGGGEKSEGGFYVPMQVSLDTATSTGLESERGDRVEVEVEVDDADDRRSAV